MSNHPHTHKDDRGILHVCYHHCKPFLNWKWWLLTFIAFPLEHAIWEKFWPFTLIAHWLGLT